MNKIWIKFITEAKDFCVFFDRTYKNSFHLENDKYPWVWGIWGSRDIPDEWLEDNQKEYGKDEIKRMKVSDILKQDTTEYDYVKKWCLNEMSK